jgi:hypothetical protein
MRTTHRGTSFSLCTAVCLVSLFLFAPETHTVHFYCTELRNTAKNAPVPISFSVLIASNTKLQARELGTT